MELLTSQHRPLGFLSLAVSSVAETIIIWKATVGKLIRLSILLWDSKWSAIMILACQTPLDRDPLWEGSVLLSMGLSSERTNTRVNRWCKSHVPHHSGTDALLRSPMWFLHDYLIEEEHPWACFMQELVQMLVQTPNNYGTTTSSTSGPKRQCWGKPLWRAELQLGTRSVWRETCSELNIGTIKGIGELVNGQGSGKSMVRRLGAR